MRCCHDKRLRILRLLHDCFSQYLSLFSFFQLSWSKWPFFVFLRNINLKIEILKNRKYQNTSTLLSSTFLLLRPFLSDSCFVGRLRCANLAEWHNQYQGPGIDQYQYQYKEPGIDQYQYLILSTPIPVFYVIEIAFEILGAVAAEQNFVEQALYEPINAMRNPEQAAF